LKPFNHFADAPFNQVQKISRQASPKFIRKDENQQAKALIIYQNCFCLSVFYAIEKHLVRLRHIGLFSVQAAACFAFPFHKITRKASPKFTGKRRKKASSRTPGIPEHP